MSAFDGISLATLAAWLSEAQVAYQALCTGTQTVSVRMGDMSVTYTSADPDKLRQHITDLQSAIVSSSGGGRTPQKGVYITGGKGL